MVAAEEKAQDRYTVLEEIGHGSFGSVCKIQRTDGKIFVLPPVEPCNRNSSVVLLPNFKVISEV